MTSELEDPDTPDASDASDDGKVRKPYNWKRRVPRILFLVGITAGLLQLVPALPHRQTLVFRLDTGVQPVRQLEATWTRYGASAPTGGVTLQFPEHAPRHVRHQLDVPNGEYVLAIVLDRAVPETTPHGRVSLVGEEPARLRFVRRVDLEGGETIVPLWQEN